MSIASTFCRRCAAKIAAGVGETKCVSAHTTPGVYRDAPLIREVRASPTGPSLKLQKFELPLLLVENVVEDPTFRAVPAKFCR